MRPVQPVLLGAFAAVSLAAVAGAWFLLHSFWLDPAADSLPLPPEPPRLAEGPEYERCLGMLNNDPQEALNWAEAWEATGGGEGARHCAALALLGTGEAARAAERLEQLGARSRGGSAARAAVFAQASQAWMMAGDASRAFGAATLALTLTPSDVDLLVDRAIALGIMARYSDSVEDLNRALGLDPDRADAWVFRAAAWRHLDQVDQAARDVARAIDLSPTNAEALLERGIIRQLRGDVAGAREDWERAIMLSPDSPTADLAQQNLALNEAGPLRR